MTSRVSPPTSFPLPMRKRFPFNFSNSAAVEELDTTSGASAVETDMQTLSARRRMAWMIKIVLADDHPIVRQGLRAAFEVESGFTVVGEANDGQEDVKLVERRAPDVLVLDLMMPGLNGLEVARQVSQRSPKTRSVILSVSAAEPHVLEALRYGAAAYVLKGSSVADLVRAVREAAAGRHYLSPPLSQRAIESYRSRAQVAPLAIYDTLTTRER